MPAYTAFSHQSLFLTTLLHVVLLRSLVQLNSAIILNEHKIHVNKVVKFKQEFRIKICCSVQLYRFIHSVFCLTRGPKPPQRRFFHIVQSRASSFKWEYLLLSLRSSISLLRLLPRLLVTSISPFIFPSIICFRRQLLRKMWPIN